MRTEKRLLFAIESICDFGLFPSDLNPLETNVHFANVKFVSSSSGKSTYGSKFYINMIVTLPTEFPVIRDFDDFNTIYLTNLLNQKSINDE